MNKTLAKMGLVALLGLLPLSASAAGGITYGTVNGVVCRISQSPASVADRVSVGMVESGTVCPSSGQDMIWIHFMGTSAASSFAYSATELSSILQTMLGLKASSGFVTFTHVSYTPGGTLQGIGFTY